MATTVENTKSVPAQKETPAGALDVRIRKAFGTGFELDVAFALRRGITILFGASGEIQILRVVRGLGHGLDENAAQAARTIRFLPARRDGRPVDSTATVHIIFQLAS